MAVLAALVWLLDRAGAPSAIAWTMWIVPTVATLTWTLARPTPADDGDEGADSWAVYSIRWAMFGVDRPRPTAVRVIVALLFGAPLAWSMLLLGVSTVLGLFEL